MSRWILRMLLVVLPVCGCARSAVEPDQPADPPAATAQANQDPAAKQPAAGDAEQDRLLREAAAAAHLGKELADKPSAKSPGNAAADKRTTGQASAKSQPRAERIVIFTPQGPVICELRCTIDGRGNEEALERLVDDAMSEAATAEGGKLSWTRLVASPRFRYGQFGNPAVKNDEERKLSITRYDVNQDDVVDRDEMRRFVTRNLAGGGLLIVHASDPNRGQTIQAAPTWRLLDADGDQALSAAELAEAGQRLRSRDASQDELLTADELGPGDDAEPAEPMRRMSSYRTVAQALGADTNWSGLLSSIEELYSDDLYSLQQQSEPGQPADVNPTRPDAPWARKLFKQLDADGDQSLDAREVAALADRQADLSIDVRFGRDPWLALPGLIGLSDAVDALLRRAGPAASAAFPQVQARGLSGAIAPVSAQRVGDGMQIVAPRLTIDVARFDMNDGPPAAESSADVQFKRFDRDANGYLDRDEFRATGQPVGAFDSLATSDSPTPTPDAAQPGDAAVESSDGKVYPVTWRRFVARQQAAAAAIVHVYVGHAGDPLLFALDADQDGRLGAREMSAAGARLLSLDANADGQLAADEVPQRMTIQLARQSQLPDQRSDMPRLQPPQRPITRAGPEWFERMDSNGDGDVSPREFLGSAARFKGLDRNSDGFIDGAEADRADAR